ncbi:transmembrane protein 179B [Amia ocellicauda]|uniref:transmembrane protein 179B n=1 Tax=Amia ocellicauda TaxID=2972642 RepID=UPI0034638A9C
MALPWLVVLELVLYAGCFICGIITASSVTITQGEFAGSCMLYGSFQYNKTALAVGVGTSSAPSLCHFLSAMSVLVAVYCFSLVLYWVYASCVDEVKRERVWMWVSLAVAGVFLFFLLVSGCVLRIGRDTLCQASTKDMLMVKSCQDIERQNWTKPYNGAQFYSSLHNAETSVWVNFFFWVLILALLVVQRRQGSEFSGLSGGDPEWSASETEPIFHRPSRPH